MEIKTLTDRTVSAQLLVSLPGLVIWSRRFSFFSPLKLLYLLLANDPWTELGNTADKDSEDADANKRDQRREEDFHGCGPY